MGDTAVAPMDQPVLRPPDRSRTSWPELVGSSSFAAGFVIVYDRPDVHVDFFVSGQALPPGDSKRVVAFTDGNNTVVYPPYVG